MSLQSLVENYGYLAILVGTFLEGETILVLGGYAAFLGYLDLPWVMLAAFSGGFCGDQLYYFLGRRYGNRLLAWRSSIQTRARRIQALLDKYHTPVILIFRFLYGLRIVAPFAIGTSSVQPWRFLLLNAIGAVIWAVLIGGAGYLFGEALQILLGDLKHYEFQALAILIVVWGSIWFLLHRRGRAKQIKPEP